MEIPGIKENPLPKELEAFLNEVGENLGLYPETVVYNRIKNYIDLLSPKQVAWLTQTIIVTTEFRIRIFKRRCDAKDRLACEMLSLAVDGDPYSKNETVRKGLKGLWRVDNDIEAGKLLVELEVITQEEFDNIIRTGRDKELINGKTREQKLEELAAEAKTFPTADAFSMAMIMGRLKSVPQPNTANVYSIIKGKYGSAEEFWHAVASGKVEVPVEPAVEAPAPEVPEKKEKEIPPQPPKEKEQGNPRLDLMKKEIEERMAKLKGKKGTREGVEEPKILYHNRSDSTNWTARDFTNEISISRTLEDLKSIHGLVDKSRLLTDGQKEEFKELLVSRMQAYVQGEESYRFAPGLDVIDESRSKYNTVAEDEVKEPQDYTEYTYGDFEVLIKGLDEIDDLEDVLEYIDMSKVITDNDRLDLINMAEKRISELEKGV